jgi:serine/threonine protein kinase
MSPEIVSKQESFGPPSDIWAAGVVLYVLLSGTFPFKAAHSKELYCKIQKGGFLIPQFISTEASSLISAMLNIDPLKRPSAKLILEYSWFKDKTVIKNNSMAEKINEVPQIRVNLNNTFDQGKDNAHDL